MKKDRLLLLKLAPAIASVLANVVVLIVFFRHFGSMQGFFEAAQGVDGNFAVPTLMLFVAVASGALFYTVSIVLIGASNQSEQRQNGSV